MSTEGTAVQQEELTFGSEEERISAMEALGATQDSGALEQLERIRNAPVVAKEEGEDGQTDAVEQQPQTQEAVFVAPAADDTPAPEPLAAGPISLSPEELRAAGFSYTKPEDVIKGMKEKEELIKRQQAFIQERLKGGGEEAEARKRIAELEQELAQARAITQQPAAPVNTHQFQGTNSVADAAGTLSGIQAELAELRKIRIDPYDEDSLAEYQERQVKLLDMQAQALSNLAAAQAATQGGFERQRQAEEAQRQAQAQAERDRQAMAAAYAELDAVGKDAELAEYRLTRPAVEVDQELKEWRMNVASAYYGRQPQTLAELKHAVDQLTHHNADLLNKCQLAGIPTEPTRDVKTLLELCDMMDYRDGFRPNPLGGEPRRETRYDPATGRDVPVILPDLITAIKTKRLNDGYYKQRSARDFQRGAQSLAAAMAKRDPSVPELNDPSTMGTSGNATAEWAIDYLSKLNVEDVSLQMRQGDNTLLNEANRARAALGMKPMDFSQ